MTTQDRIESDIKNALTSHDELTVSVLRLIKSALHNEFIAEKKELSDESVLAIISKQAKQRKDSIAAYEKGDRKDLADQERRELDIIRGYLPEQSSEDDIKKIVEEAIAAAGDDGNFGKIMGTVMSKLKGKADGTVVSRLVKEALG